MFRLYKIDNFCFLEMSLKMQKNNSKWLNYFNESITNN